MQAEWTAFIQHISILLDKKLQNLHTDGNSAAMQGTRQLIRSNFGLLVLLKNMRS